MSTITAPGQVFHRWGGQTISPARVSRGRRNLASTIDMTLEPRDGVRRGLRNWPRIPRANRGAVAEPLTEIAALLRDPEVTISASMTRRILVLATHPASPTYGQHPTRAGFAAWALLAEIRGQAERMAA